MKYIIDSRIQSDDLTILKNITGKSINKIMVDDIGEFSMGIKIELVDTKIYILNTPTIMSDKDEYPRLTVNTNIIRDYQWSQILSNTYIEEINIIRDKVYWRSIKDEWYVEHDSGIKLKLNGAELLMISIDSLAGFIKYYFGNNLSVLKNRDDLKEYWRFKTDELLEFSRTEMNISQII